MLSLQSFHRYCYDINNGVRPFCFDRAYQSAIAARVHPLKHRLLQTLNYWVPPAAHLSRQTNSFISSCAACPCTTSLPKTKQNKNMWGCTGNLWDLPIVGPRWRCNMSACTEFVETNNPENQMSSSWIKSSIRINWICFGVNRGTCSPVEQKKELRVLDKFESASMTHRVTKWRKTWII